MQIGYVHGSKDADVSQAAAIEKYGPLAGVRRWGITLKDIVLVDLDSERAVRDFRRIVLHVPADKWLGVARTPRGWHVYLDCPGFTQRALNLYMTRWLDDWHGTDPSKVSRRGFLMDFRTGENRYAVWPAVDRYWTTPGELLTEMARVAGEIPDHRLHKDGSLAPWNLPMTDTLKTAISEIGTYDEKKHPIVRNDDGSIHKGYAIAELNRWCRVLRGMAVDSGRNNMLNRITYYAGARAIKAGMDQDFVRKSLEDAAYGSGLGDREVSPTINSGERSGLAILSKLT